MKYDQHFLIDDNIAKQIVKFLEIKENEKVLEIGAGKGIITKYLRGNITVVEIDDNLCNKLKDNFPNINVVNANILNYRGDFDKIISNVPFSICEPLMNKLLKIKFKKVILILPNNFMNKGVLSLVMPHFFDIREIMQINKVSFYPNPKRNCRVLEIKPRILNNNEKLFRKIYIQSDKKLKNIIKRTNLKLNIDFLEKRVYQMNYKDWHELINVILGPMV